MEIRVEHLSKRFGDHVAVDDVSFTVQSGELAALLGPSGGGKSTVLRMIAGLEQPDSGAVFVGGEPIDHLDARARGMGFVFQHYALFRHMTVAENVAFGLRVRGESEAAQKARVHELLALVGLAGFDERLPSELSGGQRQRVALARALAPRPSVLLLDEPFGAVDAKVREELRRWLRKLHDEMHVTSIFVTHDQDEAFSVSDRVLVISRGVLEQDGTPQQILDTPATEFVARFVGDVNVYEAVVKGGVARIGGLSVPVEEHADGTRVRVVVRFYDLKFWREDPGIAIVRRVLPLGDRVRVEAELDGAGPIFSQFPRRSSLLHGIEPGARIQVEVTHARVWPITS
jgi:sulfate/thiosulfate transport system ATP-binding protein